VHISQSDAECDAQKRPKTDRHVNWQWPGGWTDMFCMMRNGRNKGQCKVFASRGYKSKWVMSDA